MTPQELKMVCGESDAINGEKIVLCSIAEEKLFAFDKVCKNCMFKLGDQKCLIMKKNHSLPPNVSKGPPFMVLIMYSIVLTTVTLITCLQIKSCILVFPSLNQLLTQVVK